jgi:outer membrane autotransporter protein
MLIQITKARPLAVWLLALGTWPSLYPFIIPSFNQIIQPIGQTVRVWSDTSPIPFAPTTPPNPDPSVVAPTNAAEEVNYICAQWDPEEKNYTAPFTTTTPITEIIITQPQRFVRLFTNPPSGTNGPWIMRSNYVRGLTPAQLQDVFALAYIPQEIVNVEIPASPDPVTGKNYALWTGIAAPIRHPPDADWGDGGSVQNRFITDPPVTATYPVTTNYFPTYLYPSSSSRQHRQSIGAIALSYQPMAVDGNNHRIASYLDGFIPTPFSDLETIYNDLDYLNWNSPTYNFNQTTYTAYFNQALQQVGPEPYEALSFLGMRNALLAGNTFFERAQLSSALACADSKLKKDCLWLQGVGEFDNKHIKTFASGFNASTFGLAGGIDGTVHRNTVVGLGVAGMGNSLHWRNGGGYAHATDLQVGLYTSYTPSCFFIDGALQGGYTWTNAHRTITFNPIDNFAGLNRTTTSRPQGYDIAAHVQAGCNIGTPWCIEPLARLSYFYTQQEHFSEQGANSLNLAVNAFDAHTLRLHLGTEISRVFADDRTRFVPQIRAGWTHDFVLDNRSIKAHLIAAGGTMTVHAYRKDDDSFIGGVTLNVLFANAFTIFGHYDTEVRNHVITNVLGLGTRWLF